MLRPDKSVMILELEVQFPNYKSSMWNKVFLSRIFIVWKMYS